MKTVMLTSESTALRNLLEQASRENLILQAADGREFVLAEIDSFDREIELTRHNDTLMQLLDQRGKERGAVSLAEARERLLAN
ncbi:MAG: hypothetical protein WA040_12635 [Anaerolineae bacterium]